MERQQASGGSTPTGVAAQPAAGSRDGWTPRTAQEQALGTAILPIDPQLG
jgi:hypothetical protein